MIQNLESQISLEELDQILPTFKLKKISYENYKAFEKHSFTPNDRFNCFIGSNGTGKSTTLETLQLMFTKFDGKNKDQIENYLKRGIRREADNFLIEAIFESDLGEYAIRIDKSGFLTDHPKALKSYLHKICYLSNFDNELNKFNLKKEKWDDFKFLFESITGYSISQEETVFDMGDIEDYILGFWVQKDQEKIYYTECSAGERKVLKSISTLLNMDFVPRIILIDNIEMHVEPNRHVALMEGLKRCFPHSQFFTTTHSKELTRYLKRDQGLFDLRLIHASKLIQEEPFRLTLLDEIFELQSKVLSLSNIDENDRVVLLKKVELMKEAITTEKKKLGTIASMSKSLVNEINDLFLDDIVIK